MKNRNVYTVYYRMNSWENEKFCNVIASNKAEAYDIATYEKIPEIEGGIAYSTWVESVTYQNGNCRRFNTSDGNPY